MNFPKPFTFARRHMWDAAEIDQFVLDRRSAEIAGRREANALNTAAIG